MSTLFDVLIVGAGPAGLAAGIAATKAGLSYQIIEKGALVNSLLHYPTEMVFFTTPELMEIGGLPFVSPHDKPTRLEALRYYRRCTDTFKLDIVFDETVVAVRRSRHRRRWRGLHGRDAARRTRPASRAAEPHRGARHRRLRLRQPDRRARRGSAARLALLHLAASRSIASAWSLSAARTRRPRRRSSSIAPAPTPTIVHRRAALGESIKYWVKPDIENRIKEGSVAARFNTQLVEIGPSSVVVDGPGGRETLPADARLPLDGLYLRHGAAARVGCRARRRDVRSPTQRGDLRNQRAGPLRDRRDGGGQGERTHLHRERALPRPDGHRAGTGFRQKIDAADRQA